MSEITQIMNLCQNLARHEIYCPHPAYTSLIDVKRNIMKYGYFLTIIILVACNSKDQSMEHTKNHLGRETSPYLLQHADNPVDWYPWGEEALKKAKELDKPILLSIGYSACHWCHVMEHESFEDHETAAVMNQNFICIKVDREERPDIDQVYMAYVQMTTGSGGWPLNVFLTPDLEPFYGGTYFPPDDRYGRPSWRKILLRVSEFYRNEKDVLNKNIDAVRSAFDQNFSEESGAGLPDIQSLDKAAEKIAGMFDPVHGGLGSAPKFPAIQPLQFLLQYYHRTGKEKYLKIVTHSLRKMAEGGIYDQIGGGFARYSVDEKWLVPHFEKMLYDNAQLVPLYLDAYLVTKDDFFLRIVTETLEFVMREMLSPEGGFYSSLDADSEGEEGKFYVWHKQEVDALLGSDSDIFCDYYDITAAGNFEGTNILNVRNTVASTAARFGKSEPETEEVLKRSREKMLAARSLRVRPGLDDKVLTSWNALMLSAFARVYQSHPDDKYRKVIENNLSFLKKNLYMNEKLFRTYNHGKTQIDGFLEDYAFLIRALLDAYEAVFDSDLLIWADQLMKHAGNGFWDEENGGYYFTSATRDDLIFRLKDEHDQSIPSGTGVMLLNNLRFYALTENTALISRSESILKKYSQKMISNPYGYGSYLIGSEFFLQKPQEILVVTKNATDLAGFSRIIFEEYRPVKTVVMITAGQFPHALSASLFQGKDLIDGKSTAYVCHDFACSAPVTDPFAFKALLAEQRVRH